MLQTFASVKDDLPSIGALGRSALIYLDVPDLSAIESKLEGVEVLVPRRKTFYGAEEIFVREPGGHVVGFAQH
jgi:hypothetical protein